MTAVDPAQHAPVAPAPDEQARDAIDLEQFGYQQELRRAISPLASLAVAFSMISVSTGVLRCSPSRSRQSVDGASGCGSRLPPG
jgi:hypothetical protein